MKHTGEKMSPCTTPRSIGKLLLCIISPSLLVTRTQPVAVEYIARNIALHLLAYSNLDRPGFPEQRGQQAERQLPCIAVCASERQFQFEGQMLGESGEAYVQALGLCAQEVYKSLRCRPV